MLQSCINKILFVAGLLYFVACADVQFSEMSQSSYYPKCVITPEYGNRCTFSGNSDLGKVDILFVNDNSGSMSTEHSKMADKFEGFIDTLDNKKIDYQIAITTTDISGPIVVTRKGGEQVTLANGPTPWNKNGTLQDGKFIEFPNGATILKSTLAKSNKIEYFAKTIQRPETLHCEKSNFKECPSSDERGIYAINKALDRANSSFFRNDSHFAVVILSDEDVRSAGDGPLVSGDRVQLEPEDTPEYLVSRLERSLGSRKNMSVHSIIVKDDACQIIQSSQGAGIDAYHGTYYKKLSNPSRELKEHGNIVAGNTGNICASNYASQLTTIASSISTSSFRLTLPCTPEDDDVARNEGFEALDINVTPDPGFEVRYSVEDNNNVSFSPNLPAGSTIEYSVVCKKK